MPPTNHGTYKSSLVVAESTRCMPAATATGARILRNAVFRLPVSEVGVYWFVGTRFLHLIIYVVCDVPRQIGQFTHSMLDFPFLNCVRVLR